MAVSLQTKAIWLILLTVFGISLFAIFFRGRTANLTIIENDLKKLVAIFDSINKDCVILSFDQQKNAINFLNVERFTGSEVGPMNLRYPQNWKGPYMQDNPTLQGKEYQIVYTDRGYFITPGDGVRLPNGKQIGKDIILDQDADVAQLMTDDNGLRYNNKALAAPLELDQTESPLPVGLENFWTES